MILLRKAAICVAVLFAVPMLDACSSSGGAPGTGGNTGSGSGGAQTGGTGGSGDGGTGGSSTTSGSGGKTTGGATGSGGLAAGGNGQGGAASGGAGASGGAAGSGQGGISHSGGTSGGGGAAGNGRDAGGNSGGIGAGGRTNTGGITGAGGATGSAGSTGTAGSSGGQHWVGTWTGAPQLVESSNNPPAALSNSTLRQVVHVSLGGSQIRVHFSNEFSSAATTINKAHVAVCKATPLVDSAIDVSTDKALTFSGKESVTIAADQAVWSDPLDFTLAPLSNVSVTIAYGSAPAQGNVTGHPGSRTTSYQVTSSAEVSAASMSSAQTAAHWYTISGIDVMADASAQGVVILGDSISDGKGSENGSGNNNKRWPDDLAVRLQANAATANVAVMNQGIGGNVVQGSGLGPSATSRFSRDVLGQSGVRWLIIFEGTNDIGSEGSAASAVTSAYDSFIKQAHAQNILVYGATITPFGGNSYYSSSHESVRQSVNTYIKSGKFDGYIDFDAALSDGGSPPKLKSTYDSGDGLHPSVAGHQKLADSVDLTLFAK